MKKILKILTKIGLNEKESQVYLKCLEFGGLTVTGLQRILLYPRTSLYDTLQKLELKGYIGKSKRKQTLTFYAVSVQELMALMEDKVQDFNRKKILIQENTSVFNELIKGTHIIPQVKMYQGRDALSLIYDQVKKTSIVRTIYSVRVSETFLDESIINKVHKEHQKLKTNKKILLVNEKEAINEQKRLINDGFCVKILPLGFPINGDIMIMDQKVLFISYGESIQAIEIQQPIFVNTQKSMFEIIRQSI